MPYFTARQLKRAKRGLYNKFIAQQRKDVSYLLKPRPFLMPFTMWIWLLSKLLRLDNESIKTICSTSSSIQKAN
jgi:hypothetical protein